VASRAARTNAASAAHQPFRPVEDPVPLSSHLAFEPPHERKIYCYHEKLCHDDVGKIGIVDTADVDTIRPACRVDDDVFSMLADQRSGLPISTSSS
jgi:hypothetical protein